MMDFNDDSAFVSDLMAFATEVAIAFRAPGATRASI